MDRTSSAAPKARRDARWRITSRLLAALVLVTLPAVGAWAASPTEAFDPSRHEAITRDALPFLRTTVLEKVASGNSSQDFGIDDKSRPTHHFDDCEFAGTSSYIRDEYASAMNWLRANGRPRLLSAAYELGRLLHPVQDFYSHSNWVEWRLTDLLDTHWGTFQHLTSWSTIPVGRPGPTNDVVVGEGEHVPDGWEVPRMIEFLPRVRLPNGDVRRVIVTGESKNPFDDQCHDEMTEHHDKINKDDPKAWYYSEARALAVRQTEYEWCRTLQRARAIYGSAGSSALMGLWVRPTGWPHPRNTPCESRQGSSGWRVRVTGIQVKNTLDEAAAGEINITFALFGSDFRQSKRSQIGPLPVAPNGRVARRRLPEPLKVCATGGKPPVATVQGWDDDDGLPGALDIYVPPTPPQDTETSPPPPPPPDTDDVLEGVTLPLSASGTSTALSNDLRIRFVVERLNVSNDPDPCVGTKAP